MFKQRLIHKLILLVSIVFAGTVLAESIAIEVDYTAQQASIYDKHNIILSGALSLASQTTNDEPLMEFSGVAWDQDDAILYALSDRGYFVSLQPVFEENRLIDLVLLTYHHLLDEKGKPVKYKFSDSEGLALMNANNGIHQDTQLLVSFERRSRIIRYDTNGVIQEKLSIPHDLTEINNFKSENKSLEALTDHPAFKIVAGSERPLKNNTVNLFSIPFDQRWSFTPENSNHGSLVGLTTLGNGNIVALERSFPGIFAGVTNTLHLLSFNNGFKQQQLVQFKPSHQLFNDNFEGIAWHKSNYFFMISDDNDNPLQRSLLIYFAVKNLNQYVD